jgi:hypothetical protein
LALPGKIGATVSAAGGLMSPHELARAILIRVRAVRAEREINARVGELKQLAEDTSEAYEQMLAASGLTREHFRLRAMLLGLLPPPRKGA